MLVNSRYQAEPGNAYCEAQPHDECKAEPCG